MSYFLENPSTAYGNRSLSKILLTKRLTRHGALATPPSGE